MAHGEAVRGSRGGGGAGPGAGGGGGGGGGSRGPGVAELAQGAGALGLSDAPPEREGVPSPGAGGSPGEDPGPRRGFGDAGVRLSLVQARGGAAARGGQLSRSMTLQDGACSLRLVVTRGPSQGLQKKLRCAPGKEYRVGRKGFCDVMLNDHEVSSEHVAIRWDAAEGVWAVRDVGSLNGTELNGMSIQNVGDHRNGGEWFPLSDGDDLGLADSTGVSVELVAPEDESDGESPGGAAGARRAMLGGGRGKLLRKVNQGATMLVASGGEDGGPWVPMLETCRRPDARVAEHRESGAATFIAAGSLGAYASAAVRQGAKHAKAGLPSEDSVFVSVPACEAPGPLAGAFGLCDGHKGSKASTLARGMLMSRLRHFLLHEADRQHAEDGWREQLARAFLDADREMQAKCLEGCTATVVLCWRPDPSGPTRVQVANVGDSMCLFVDVATREYRHLTACHRIQDDAENARLRALGVEVVPGQLRLDGLQLSRCLGDREFKEVYPEAIVAEPHVSGVVEVGPEGALVIVGSDGLWDAVTFAQATDLVLGAMDGDAATGADALNVARDVLVEEALEGGSADDIALQVIRLLPASRILGQGVSLASLLSDGGSEGRRSRRVSERGRGGSPDLPARLASEEPEGHLLRGDLPSIDETGEPELSG